MTAIPTYGRQSPNPGGTSMAKDDPLTDDTQVGDINATSENHVLDGPDLDTIDVVVNVGLARTPNGHHPILVRGPSTLTAAQAHQLHVDLEIASGFVADIRRDAGYES